MISIQEYYRELAKYAMGWLGWSEKQSLKADVNSILVAMEGKLEMMYPDKTRKKLNKTNFGQRWQAFVKDHNAAFRARNKGKTNERPADR